MCLGRANHEDGVRNLIKRLFAPVEMVADGDIMASVEEGPTDQFILADVTRDDAYLTTPLADAASLPAWR
ncbi:hypothetical protein C9J85_13700 [Haloferax sp. wsp5]|nr:hypothetical protein C9J85_13700 [Haloferax sp. wsp5]